MRAFGIGPGHTNLGPNSEFVLSCSTDEHPPYDRLTRERKMHTGTHTHTYWMLVDYRLGIMRLDSLYIRIRVETLCSAEFG